MRAIHGMIDLAQPQAAPGPALAMSRTPRRDAAGEPGQMPPPVPPPNDVPEQRRSKTSYSRTTLGGFAASSLSATLENEADPTLENEATGSCLLVCRVLGSDAGQSVDPAVA
ncbi:hypothetical protein GCM10027596_41170 [Nocardioides korecus]